MPRNYKPYLLWTRAEMKVYLVRQCVFFGQEHLIPVINEICEDENWNPMEDYNGCSIVQDLFHPYVPCFIHDYNWIVNGGGKEYDLMFKDHLKAFGKTKAGAGLFYTGVRIGWIFYFKWKKMFAKK